MEEIGRDVSLDDESAVGVFHQPLLYMLAHLFCPLADFNPASTI
jgi:hypothetical protein